MHTPGPVELLAPAGGPAQLRAALDAGADAVYFGVDRLNMRVRARNFSLDELPNICSTLHAAGAKAYLTLNTLVFESELEEVETVLRAAVEAKVDAVIAADWAVIRKAKALGMPVHVSTQLSVSNSATLAFLFDLGIRRVVLARECSLQDLQNMRQALAEEFGEQATAMEFEVFAHGAMCVAESGRCFMSGIETGRSASRGDCAQPCRQAYTITSSQSRDGFRLEGEHVLSPKDLCTIPFLDELLDAGVSSLKIEGRNRSPDYVYTVVKAYRKAMDAYWAFRGDPEFTQKYAEVKREALESVQRVYNRGFSQGYYMGRPMKAWTTDPGNQAVYKRSYIGQVMKSVAVERRTRVRLESDGLAVGDRVFFEGPETGFQELTISELRQEGRVIQSGEKGAVLDLISDKLFYPADRLYRYVPAE